ncbi:MAG TPA: protoheme IX farnesyltransferase [Bacteroidales bacterium]|nr:protoheme IX farnesyltransferase [Bacteroidales bacterium]
MGSRAGSKFRYFPELGKLKIMIPVSLTAFAGYFLFSPHITLNLLFLTSGILFIAVSASVLNQIQEAGYDKKMERTRNRPLPAGNLSPKDALSFFILTFSAGIILISSTGSLVALFLCIFTMLWYNFVYTYLKRITAFAVIPGALTGALPPLIGWIAAGGDPLDIKIILIQALFFCGQIPHFWLFILKYGSEYQAAGFPTLTSRLSQKSIVRLILILIVVSACLAACLVFYGLPSNRIFVSLVLSSSLLLIASFTVFLIYGGKQIKRYSIMLDSYFLLIILLLIADRII